MSLWQTLRRKTIKPKTDFEWLCERRCPDCHEFETLCEGPCGGAAMNVACSACLSEFVMVPGFGVLDRNGKISAQRARQFYGIT